MLFPPPSYSVSYQGWTFVLSHDSEFVDVTLLADNHDLKLTAWLKSPSSNTVIEYLKSKDLTPIYHEEDSIFLRTELLPLLLSPEYITTTTPIVSENLVRGLVNHKISKAKDKMGDEDQYIDFGEDPVESGSKVTAAAKAYAHARECSDSIKAATAVATHLSLLCASPRSGGGGGKLLLTGQTALRLVHLLLDVVDLVPEIEPIIDDLMSGKLRKMKEVSSKLTDLQTAIDSEERLRLSTYRILLAMLMVNHSHCEWKHNREKMRLREIASGMAATLYGL